MNNLNPERSRSGKLARMSVQRNRGAAVAARRECAFTLIELMAVVLTIAILAGITLGVVGYVNRRVAVQTTRAQMTAIEAALEMYKSDWGYYPVTTAPRISVNGIKEATNNWHLYRALVGDCLGCKRYLSFPLTQVKTNYTIAQPTICDFWGTPFNYYNSPATPYSLTTDVYIVAGTISQTNLYGYTLGGQVNVGAYDLFSYGPDQFTYVPGVVNSLAWRSAGSFVGSSNVWMRPASAVDDVANF